MELICYTNDTLDRLMFTPRGESRLLNNEEGRWFITAAIKGLVHPDYLYLIEDDKERENNISLANTLYPKILQRPEHVELTGDEVEVQCTRNQTVSCKLKYTERYLRDSYQDIIAGFSAYTVLTIKLHRLPPKRKRRKKR